MASPGLPTKGLTLVKIMSLELAPLFDEDDPDFTHATAIDTIVPIATTLAIEFRSRIKAIPLMSKRKSDLYKITEG